MRSCNANSTFLRRASTVKLVTIEARDALESSWPDSTTLLQPQCANAVVLQPHVRHALGAEQIECRARPAGQAEVDGITYVGADVGCHGVWQLPMAQNHVAGLGHDLAWCVGELEFRWCVGHVAAQYLVRIAALSDILLNGVVRSWKHGQVAVQLLSE
jgi:hypothetical protein